MKELDRKKLSQLIEKLRKSRDLSRAEMGSLLGVSGRTVKRWETNRSLYDNSTDWGPTWHQYRTGTVSVPNSLTNELVNALASVLLNKLLGPYATYVSGLFTIANALIDYNVQFQYGNAYFVQYYRSNYHCYILSKTYASYYTSSSMSTYLGSSSVGHFWSATPWNYSYPAPCRTLVNTYPA